MPWADLSVIPSPQQWRPAAGTGWRPGPDTRIVVGTPDAAGPDGMLDQAELLADGIRDLTGLPPAVAAVGEPARSGDVVLARGAVTASASPEAYHLEVDVDRVAITGATVAGVHHGGRTLLAQLRAEREFPAGAVTDWPVLAERGLSVDLGRKHYTKEWLEARIRELADLRLNTLQLHFSENLGFRVESTRHPEVVSAEHLTHADIRDLIALARRHHVTVIPALDMPGHLGQVLRAHPELRLPTATGHDDTALNIADPAAVALAYDLVDEYADLFGGTRWHLGADEFIDLEDADTTHPALRAAAVERYGAAARAADLFTGFVNDLAEHLRGKGYTDIRAWNDGMYRVAGVVGLDPRIAITYWTRWDRRMAPVQRFVDAGHRLVNFHDSFFYYVLGKDDVYPHRSGEEILARWEPTLFPDPDWSPTGAVPAWLIGASFSIWSDVPDAESEDEVAEGIRLPLHAMAQRAWSG